MTMLLVWNPLCKDPPEDAENEANENLNRSVESQLPDGSTCVEGETEKDSKARDGNHVVGRACCDHKGGDPLGNSKASLGEGHQAWDDDSRRHGCQNEAQHEADSPGKTKHKVAEDGDHDRLDEAGDEGGSDHHGRQFHQGNGIELKAGHEEDNRETDGPESSADRRVQVVPDILGMAVVHVVGVGLRLLMVTTTTSTPCHPVLVPAAPRVLQQLLLHVPRLLRRLPFLLQLCLLSNPHIDLLLRHFVSIKVGWKVWFWGAPPPPEA